ncbi:Ig-like domain-containing protein [Clostridium hydrogeniformans]|uniref:Ig-like domain-containing protein n=1 Tax=Clostridium hydrogeniformans TaxID=349933 RepID=UPI00068E506E|nr:Ig-like domain-containing protein [Clostridium hydrogeniformans]
MKKNFKILSFIMIVMFMTNIFLPIKAFANENESQNLLTTINSLKERVKNKKTKAYLDALTLKALDVPVNKNELISSDVVTAKVYSGRIIGLLSAKEDIFSEENKKYIDTLVKSQGKDGFLLKSGNEFMDLDVSSISLAIIALNMADASYDKAMAKGALIKAIDNAGDIKISEISIALVALSFYKNDGDAKVVINKLKEKVNSYLNDEGKLSIPEDDGWGWVDYDESISYNGDFIQALIALGEDPKGEKWTKNGKNLIDGLNSFDVDTEDNAVTKLAALVDYYSYKYSGKGSMYKLKYEKVIPKYMKFENKTEKLKLQKTLTLEPKVYDSKDALMLGKQIEFSLDNEEVLKLEGNKVTALKEGKANVKAVLKENRAIETTLEINVYAPTTKSLNIEVNEDDFPIKVNDTIELKVSAKDEDGERLENQEVIWSSEKEEILKVDKDGIVKALKVGDGTIKVSLKDNEEIFALKELKVEDNLGLKEINNKQKSEIKKEIDNLVLHYEGEITGQFLAPLALSKVGVKKTPFVSKRQSNVFDYDKAIIAILGAGEDPRNYNGRDFIKELSEIQVKDGENKGLFIKNDFIDKDALIYQGYAILALDMAKADYDKDSAIDAIMKLYKSGKYNTFTFNYTENRALLMTVLAGVKSSKERDLLLKELITDIKNSITENMQFDSKHEPRAVSMIIQGLVANNINPLGKSFVKGDKNLLTTLLSYKATSTSGREKVAGITNGKGTATHVDGTFYGFSALVELYTGESIFGVKNSVEVKDEEPPVITVDGIENDKVYRDDVTVKISSTKGDKWTALLNGEEFKSGEIEASGIYNLEIEATDESGNKSKEKRSFALDKNASNKIKVRVEGRDKTLFNEEVSYGDAAKNLVDLLKLSVGIDKVEGINQGKSGFYVNSILGNKEGETYGWSYYVVKGREIVSPMLAADKFTELKDEEGNGKYDEYVFYMSEYIGQDILTTVPIVTHEVKEDNVILKFKNWKGHPLLHIRAVLNEKEYTADINGEITIPYTKEIKVSLGTRGSYIEIVPAEFTMTIEDKKDESKEENKEENKEDKDGKEENKEENKEDKDGKEENKEENKEDKDGKEENKEDKDVKEESKEENKKESILEKVKEALEALKEGALKEEEVEFRTALALFNEKDSPVDEMKDKLIFRDNDAVAAVASNIIGIIAIGENPYSYKGINHVKLLEESQKENGLFVINPNDEKYPTIQSYALIALNMAKGTYNKESAVKAIMNMDNGGYSDADLAAILITALSNYKDIDGVNEFIEKQVAYIKSEISKMDGNNINPYTLSAVINGLKASGQDPLSNDFRVGNSNIVELLLNFRNGENFEFKTEGGVETTMITEQGLLALSDLLKDSSVFNKTFDFNKGEKDTKEENKEDNKDEKDTKEEQDNNKGGKEDKQEKDNIVSSKDNHREVTSNNITGAENKESTKAIENEIVASNNTVEKDNSIKENISSENENTSEDTKGNEENKEESEDNKEAKKEPGVKEDKKEEVSKVTLSSYKKNMIISLVALGSAVLLIVGYIINKKKVK